MESRSFVYQSYWLRVLILLPIIVILPLIEYIFLKPIGNIFFWGGATVITFAVAFMLYKPLGAIIKSNGTMEFSDIEIIIHQKKNTYIKIMNISDILCERRFLYGVEFCLLIISYINDEGKKRTIKIVSEDLNGRQIECCDLYKCYKQIELRKKNELKSK